MIIHPPTQTANAALVVVNQAAARVQQPIAVARLALMMVAPVYVSRHKQNAALPRVAVNC
ncbi:MAG: hypothetical protein V7785_00750 [Bermanella sp.]